MPASTGSSSPAKSSSSIEPAGPLTLARLVVLLIVGVLIVALHESFNYPLKIPGHHGLEAMALLVFARLTSTYRWAATIVSLSAATTAAGVGAEHGWLTPFLYLAPGVVIDLAVMVFAGWRTQILVLPLIAAFAHATKPLMRFGLAETFGMEFGSFRAGVLYPISTHLAFGFAGGLAGALLWREWARRAAKQQA